jgi:hypothetical protein
MMLVRSKIKSRFLTTAVPKKLTCFICLDGVGFLTILLFEMTVSRLRFLDSKLREARQIALNDGVASFVD